VPLEARDDVLTVLASMEAPSPPLNLHPARCASHWDDGVTVRRQAVSCVEVHEHKESVRFEVCSSHSFQC
jgi:hypothetical protein